MDGARLDLGEAVAVAAACGVIEVPVRERTGAEHFLASQTNPAGQRVRSL